MAGVEFIMAISIVFNETKGVPNQGSSITITGAQAGDLVLISASNDNQYTLRPANDPTANAWTAYSNQVFAYLSGVYADLEWVWYQDLPSDELTFNSAGTGGAVASVIVLRGVDQTTPLDLSQATIVRIVTGNTSATAGPIYIMDGGYGFTGNIPAGTWAVLGFAGDDDNILVNYPDSSNGSPYDWLGIHRQANIYVSTWWKHEQACRGSDY